MKIQISNAVSLFTLEETEKIAKTLAKVFKKGDCIALSGDLGAGKTTFARFLLKALNPKIEDVPSPTFTLLQTYETSIGPVSHFDWYRLEHPDELRELGFEETYQEGVVLIEWPEKAQGFLPKNTLWITFTFGSVDSSQRKIVIEGHDSWEKRMQIL